MSDSSFSDLQRSLRASGMPAWRIDRTVEELHAHFLDLRDEAIDAGLSPDQARIDALKRLGSTDAIASSFAKSGACEAWPAGAHALALAEAMASDDVLPRAQVLLWRWSAASVVAAVSTLALFFALHNIIYV